jgi:hypothetical protein
MAVKFYQITRRHITFDSNHKYLLVLRTVFSVRIQGPQLKTRLHLTHFFYSPLQGSQTIHCVEHGVPQTASKAVFSTFVRPRPGKFFAYKTRARGPTNLLVNTFSIFLSSYIKLV